MLSASETILFKCSPCVSKNIKQTTKAKERERKKKSQSIDVSLFLFSSFRVEPVRL